MKGYERIYVVSEWHVSPCAYLYGGCWVVAYRDFNEAKAKYREMKDKVLELYAGESDIRHIEVEGQFLKLFQEINDSNLPFPTKKIVCIIQIEKLDLKE